MANEKGVIPQHLDEPFKLILWTIDELLVVFVPFLVLMFCFNSPVVGMVIAAVCLIGLKKVKGEAGHYYLHHAMYWYLPNLLHFKKTPPSYIREWLG